jgi:hypothetical protein
MRTTVDIDTDLMRALKERGNREGVSLRKTLNEALRRGLATGSARSPRRYRCPSVSMGYPAAPMIDLDKALALAFAMEDAEVARELELRK